MAKQHILIPYHPAEGMSVTEAARMAGMSPRRIREWCAEHGIGRHIFPGGPWIVSRVALRMLLEGDADALISYLHGARASYAPVAAHYARADLGHLLELRDFAV
jgi:Helix-turn-helix domain